MSRFDLLAPSLGGSPAHIAWWITRHLVIAAIAAYAVGVVVLATLWSFAPNAHWAIAFSNIFAAEFFLPLLLLVPCGLLMRSRVLWIATGITLTLFLLLFGARFIPRTGVMAAAGEPTFRVLTLNQQYANTNATNLVAAIRAEHADVIAIQELIPRVADAMRQAMKADYPFQLMQPFPGVEGLGLLSRYPMTATNPARGAQGQWATMALNGYSITIVNVHLRFSGIARIRSQRFGTLSYFRMYDRTGRLAQAEALRQAVHNVNGSVIVMGDFNTGDREPGHAVLAAELHDAFAERGVGFGFTFPNHKRMGPITVPVPLVRIDYVWTRGSVVPLSARANCAAGGSDHCMVVAELRLTN